ncbi:MAG: translation elongation factor EF-1 subunit alpha [Candidatus Woesearchaeota archaeon]|nr:MAG: translation elongation factor EF-1 subunit alpha [Candidatus Woesearchaeota archaeon]
MADKKPHINLVFIGHVDHGKSTTVGRLLFDTGSIEATELEKHKKEAQELGKAGFEFAFVMDKVKEERERGVTINLAYKRFETQKNYFTIIDAPGHKDFIKNMITGTSQADAAVLCVAANDGVMEQTREHLFLAKTLGIPQIMIAITKMDIVKYDQGKFNAVKDDMVKLLGSVGYKADEVKFIPTAALKGDNVAKKSENMSWYTGPILLEALDDFKPGEKPTNLPLRMPIQDVYTIKGIGAVPVGRIETGIMKVNQKVVVMPSGKPGEIKSIEMHHEQMQQAEPGDNVGINVRGIGKEDVRRGDVLGPADNPPKPVKEFQAQIIVLSHPTVVTAGYCPVFHVNTAQVSCTIKKLDKKIDPRTGATVQENPDFLKPGDAAIITVEPTRPLIIEEADKVPQMSKLAIRDMGRTVAAGRCIKVVPK